MDRKSEMAQIGARLREARTRAGMTQEEAAAATGVKRPAVSNWEAGRNLPCLLQFRELLSLYGATAFQILFGPNPLTMTREEAQELSRAAVGFSPELQSKIDLLLTMLAKTSPGD
jgi:transcriptional regulator with XRE-family HTH domain